MAPQFYIAAQVELGPKGLGSGLVVLATGLAGLGSGLTGIACGPLG